jgi:hypothetical protein
VFHSILPLFVIAITAATAAVALLFGDEDARLAGGINFINAVALPAYHMIWPSPTSEAIELAGDFLWAVGLLILVLRHASLWLGATMLLQAVQFGLHAYYIVMDLRLDLLHAWINNLDEVGISVCIFAGTLTAMRRRAEMAKEERQLHAGGQQQLSRAG